MLAPIKDFSAIGMLLYIAFAIRGSAYQPEGGALKAAEAFEEAARRNGVDLQYSKKVAQIQVEQGRACGVRLEDGETVEARYVVSAADLRQTCYKLLDATLVPADFKKKLENTPLSGTFVIVSLVTDIDPATIRVGGDGRLFHGYSGHRYGADAGRPGTLADLDPVPRIPDGEQRQAPVRRAARGASIPRVQGELGKRRRGGERR